MKRGIKRVRHSIRRRKKKRNYNELSSMNDYSSLYLPEQEERHGIYHSHIHPQYSFNERRSLNKTALKGMLSFLLFVSFALILKLDFSGFEKPKQFANHYLNEEFPFAKVNDWYVETFGQPLALLPERSRHRDETDERSLPVSGQVTEPFNLNGKGIMISPQEDTSVLAFNSGVVIFAGNDRETKKTVTIQHPDNSKSTYGHLSSIDVHLYQIIQVNDHIGTFEPSKNNENVYFAIEKNNSFVDPVQVIQVDNRK